MLNTIKIVEKDVQSRFLSGLNTKKSEAKDVPTRGWFAFGRKFCPGHKMSGKKIALFISALFVSATLSFSQKVAYVDIDYILSNIPEYKTAQAELDKISIQWQKEIEQKLTEVDKLYKAFQAEEILLTEDMKKKREAEIIAKEKEAKELQKQRFGVGGDLYKKRQELVKPIQDKVYNAVKTVAEKGTYAMILNKSEELNILYANPRYDKSDEVLESMGYKPGKK